jgi:Mce-associated membrane protein
VRDNGFTDSGVDTSRTTERETTPQRENQPPPEPETAAVAEPETGPSAGQREPDAGAHETETVAGSGKAASGAVDEDERTQVLAANDGGRKDDGDTEHDSAAEHDGGTEHDSAAEHDGGTEHDSAATNDSGTEHDSALADDAEPTQRIASPSPGAEATAAGAGTTAAGAETDAAQPKPAPRAATPVGSLHRRTQHRSYAPSAEAAPKPAPASAKAKSTASRESLRLPIILAVIAVVLGAFAVFAGVKGSAAGAGSNNTALTDDAGTKDVQKQVTGALNTMFTFDYKHPDKTEKDAAPLFTKNIGGDYDSLMKVLKDNGPKAKLTLNSAVMTSGVQQLQGDRARVLALMSQTYTKGDGKSAQKAPTLAVVRVDVQKIGGKWKVNNLSMLSGSG